MNAPSGTLSSASAIGTSYGDEVPRRLRIDTVAASAPPSSPSSATTTMSMLDTEVTSVPVGQFSSGSPVPAMPSAGKHSGMIVGLAQTPAMVMATSTAMHRASMRMMFRKLRSLSCCRSRAS